ncbi:MAG TPA: PadR family transcriptional regulator [Saprospiraceae bacterium]|nr:PadR family transcriptional regulator [Saprospiraceae bacterium]
MEKKISKELQTYTITMLVFKLLKTEPSYGYKLIKDISELTNGHIQIEEGFLYPMLLKWKKAGYLDYSWEMTNNKQRRKRYKLTATGFNQYNNLKNEMKVIDDLLVK